MKEIAKGVALNQSYSIQELKGRVESETTRSETETHGRISGGQNRMSGVQGTISSKTTRFQTIYLKDDSGSEHAVELVDLIVPCREGHELTLWGINDGWWFKGVNHTTNKEIFSKSVIEKFAMPHKMIKRVTIIFGVFLFLAFAGILTGDISGLRVLWGAIGAIFFGSLFYIFMHIPGIIVRKMRSSQILASMG